MSSEKWMFALKLFLPSWNFFNDFGAVPHLEFQLVLPGIKSSDWQPLYANHSTHRFGRVSFNPWGNAELLEKSLIDRAATKLSQATPKAAVEFARSKDCEVLTRIARARIQQGRGQNQSGSFRFRLVLATPTTPVEILFVSTANPITPEVGR